MAARGRAYLLRTERHPLGEVFWSEELADDPIAARAELGPPFAEGAKRRLGSLTECARRACSACGASAYLVGVEREVYSYDPSVAIEDVALCPSCAHVEVVGSTDGYQSRIAYEGA